MCKRNNTFDLCNKDSTTENTNLRTHVFKLKYNNLNDLMDLCKILHKQCKKANSFKRYIEIYLIHTSFLHHIQNASQFLFASFANPLSQHCIPFGYLHLSFL